MFVYTLLSYSDLLKKKRRLWCCNTKAPESTPQPLKSCQARAGERKDGPMNSTPDLLELSGPARIRAMFHPRQRVGLIAAGKVLGISYCQLHRRIQQGKLALRVQKDEYGQMFVTIDDLASYLFPDEQSSQSPLPSSLSVSTKRHGRPRKEGGGR